MEVDPYLMVLGGLGLLIVLVAWLPMALSRLPLSLAIVCVLIGVALFASGVIGFDPDPRVHPEFTERLAELVVVVALTGSGLKIDRRFGLRRWGATWRLLLIAMPLTIAAVTWLGTSWLGLSLSAAILLGAALAPTDPVLASDIQVGPPKTGEEDEVRFSLTSESGLNDGLAFPFVALALAFAAGGDRLDGAGWLKWAGYDLVWRVAAGVAAGWLVGKALGWLTFRLPHRSQLAKSGDGFVALGMTFLSYAVTEGVLHGYGFIAVFVTALTLRGVERDHDYHERLHQYAEETERLLMLLVLVLFGGALIGGVLSALTWADVGVGLLLLFVVRMGAVLISMIGSSLPFRDQAALGFFGIRGIGTIYYLAYAVTEGSIPQTDRVWALAAFVIAISILIHGVTSTPLMRLLDLKTLQERKQEVTNRRERRTGDGDPAARPPA